MRRVPRWLKAHGVFIAYVLLNVIALLVLLPLVGCGTPSRSKRLVVLNAKGDTLSNRVVRACSIRDGVARGYSSYLDDFAQQIPRDGTAVCMELP